MAKINKDLFAHIAVGLQDGIENEGEALKKYQELLNQINSCMNSDYLFKIYDRVADKEVDSPTAAADKKMCKLLADKIKEYMSEEMKHLKGLTSLYEAITGIIAEEK